MPPILKTDGLTHLYDGERALGPLTLAVSDGSVGLLGPNGSGKSTLLRILVGLLEPTEGSAHVLDLPPGPELQRRIGYVPEGEARFPGLTGVASVAYAGRLVGMARSDALQRAHQVLDYVGLAEERYRASAAYSTGMLQRLKLAQALVHDPELLVLDEPTEGVDPEARLALLDLIDELQREHGLRVLLSTHLLGDVERLTREVVVLDQGAVVVHGDLEDLRRLESDAFHVSVLGDREAFLAALESAGIGWSEEHPHFRVDCPDPRRILEHAAEAGCVVRHLTPVQRGLGDALFAFPPTRGKRPDADPEGGELVA